MTEDSSSGGPNSGAIAAWDTILFDKFVRFRHLLTDGLAVHGTIAMERAARTSARVLDVGCGFGDTACVLAERVARGREVVGVDCSRRFVEAAEQEARTRAIDNVRFAVRDVQVDDLGGPYDLVFSRFGTMFFSNPVQALRNMRRAITPGAKLCMVVWRKREDNVWLHAAEKVARALVPEIVERGDNPTCGPGPFSMANADLVSDQLVAAGFERIAFERCDAPIAIGRDLDEAVDFALELGPAGELIRLAGAIGRERKPQIAAALRQVFEERRASDGSIQAPSSTWIVTASP